METHTVIISKDVVFHEKFFPYHYSTDKDNKMNQQIFLAAAINDIQIQEYIDMFPDHSYDTPVEDMINNQQTDNSDLHNVARPSTPYPTHPIALRRSERVHKPPAYLTGYNCNNTHDHWCGIVHSNTVNTLYNKNIAQHLHIEPRSYKEALLNPMERGCG